MANVTSMRSSPRSRAPAPTPYTSAVSFPEGGPLIRQLKEQGVDVVIVSGDAFAQTELVAAAGGAQNLKNVYYSATPDPLADPLHAGCPGIC
ncbi:hypothetical protein ACOJBM_32505 [Rhizobium beringeri]